MVKGRKPYEGFEKFRRHKLPAECRTSYQKFVAVERKKGKSMKAIASEWEAEKKSVILKNKASGASKKYKSGKGGGSGMTKSSAKELIAGMVKNMPVKPATNTLSKKAKRGASAIGKAIKKRSYKRKKK